jgi:hypothetical protein
VSPAQTPPAPTPSGPTPPAQPPSGRRPSPAVVVGAAVLLALPVVALVWVSTYNRLTPRLLGFPFFYWYQFLWVLLAAICTSTAYWLISRSTAR